MSKYTLDNLFGSKARVKLIKFLYRNYPGGFTVNEIARRTQESPTTIRAELNLLKHVHLVNKTRTKPQT